MSVRPSWRAAVLVAALATPLAASAAGGVAPAARLTSPPPKIVRVWHGTNRDAPQVDGRLTIDGRPVARAVVSVAGYTTSTDASGRFSYGLDRTVIARYPVRVVDLKHASVGGRPLTAAERQVLKRTQGAFTAAYRISGVSVSRRADGSVLVGGRVTFGDGTAATKTVLYGYGLYGTVRYANGQPVRGAIVGTEAGGGDSWSFSGTSSGDGSYYSYYYPNGTLPVTLRVSVGDQTWTLPRPLHLRHFGSTQLDITLPAQGFVLPRPQPVPKPGAVYDGLIVGAELDGKPVRPLSATWPDASGRFQLVLPRTAAGRGLSFFQDHAYYVAPVGTRPGTPIPLSDWPRRLGAQVPQGLDPPVSQSTETKGDVR